MSTSGSGEILIGLVNAAEGREEEFDDWYSNTHIPEILAIEGFVSAQRYVNATDDPASGPYRYATVYEVDGSAVEARTRLFGAGLASSPAMDATGMVFLAAFTPRGGRIRG